MRSIKVLPLIIAFILPLVSLAEGVKFFKGTWEELIEKANEENKPIFIDCYTTWCGPCKWMDANVFTEDNVGEYYNKNFINYKMDMEKGEGVGIAFDYNVKAYPTFLYFTKDGDIMHRTVGARKPDEFIEAGKVALDPKNNYYGLVSRYEEGERAPVFLFAMAKQAEENNDQHSKKYIEDYYNSLSKEDRYTEEYLYSLYAFSGDVTSDEFDFLEDHKRKYYKRLGKQKVENAVMYTALSSIYKAAQEKDKKLFEEAREAVRDFEDDTIKPRFFDAMIFYYERMGRNEKYTDAVEDYIKYYGMDNPELLNRFAWDYYEYIEEKDELRDALGWAKRAVELDKNYYNTDTYAALLYKLGHYEEAEKTALEAIRLAKDNFIDGSTTEELLEKIRKEKK